MNYLIDSHCHLHDREFFSKGQAEEFLKDAVENNVRQIICIGTTHADSLNARAFAEAHKNVFWTYGIHPEESKTSEACELDTELFDLYFSSSFSPELACSCGADGTRTRNGSSSEKHWKNSFRSNKSEFGPGKLIAIGEIGLDYHRPGYDREAQTRLLETMLDLAQKLELPCSFHVRDAFDDFFPILKNFPSLRPSVLHSFTDTKANLEYALENGFFIGINGIATFTNLDCYKSLTPDFLGSCVLETDAPFLTPAPKRGKINKPGNIADIAAWLSRKLGVSEATVAEKTTNNARQIFNLPNPEPAEKRSRA